MGKYYCVSCHRYFIGEDVLQKHFKTKAHKRRFHLFPTVIYVHQNPRTCWNSLWRWPRGSFRDENWQREFQKWSSDVYWSTQRRFHHRSRAPELMIWSIFSSILYFYEVLDLWPFCKDILTVCVWLPCVVVGSLVQQLACLPIVREMEPISDLKRT